MLEIDHNLSNTVRPLFLDYQWSPEEIEGRLRLEYGKAVISYQTIYRAILMRTHYLMVLVVSFASSAIVGKHVIRKVMLKIEGEFLFLIPFMKDPKKQTSELGSVIGKQILLQVKLEKLV